jgi:hypothetical protein
VVRGRPWRCTDARLSTAERGRLTSELMFARRAKRTDDAEARERARRRVDAAEARARRARTGWWEDDAPD